MAEKIRVLLADQQLKNLEIFNSLLSNSNYIKVVGKCNTVESLLSKAKESKPDVILLDINMPHLEEMSATEILTTTLPNIILIVTFNQGEKKNLTKAMEDGARGFITKPCSSDKLINTINKLFFKEQKRKEISDSINNNKIEKEPQIISVFSTKGGVGKSIIAANLATSIYKETKDRVLLIDLDLQFGDISFIMNSFSKKTIVNLVNDLNSIDNDLLDEYFIEHPSGIKILPAPHSPEYADYISNESIKKILQLFIKSYQYIIIDLSPSFQGINLNVLDISDKILFVSTLDLHAIKRINMGLNIMDSLDYPQDKIKLIINRYDKKYGVTKSDIEKTLNKKVDYLIPEDDTTVIKSINDGSPFVLSNNKCAISKSIMTIASEIIEKKPERKARVLKSLLNRKVEGTACP